MPQMGLEVTEATILEVRVAPGDPVAKDDPLFEVETEKATVEVVAPRPGVVLSVEVAAGDLVPVGAVLARIAGVLPDARQRPLQAAPAAAPAPVTSVRAAPVARRLAAARGVALESLTGTGPGGRITLRDVERAAPAPPQAPAPEAPEEPLGRLRATIARRMTESQLIPQYELQRDVDMSHVTAEKERLAGVERIGINDLIVQTIGETIVRHPALASVFVEGPPPAARQRSAIGVGFAVATEQGLVVPVIQDVPRRGLAEIAADRRRLVAAAQTGKLRPEDVSGGVITLSSLARFGVDRFRAMLNPGESAIVALGRTTDRVVPSGRGLAVVPIATITISFDHRIVDGAVGAAALAELAGLLEGAMVWRR